MSNTFFNFKLDLEPNLVDMIYDLLRMSTIQIITQVMFYMNNNSLSLFNSTFIKTFIFINISIIFYYLVIRKLFGFVSDDYLNTIDKPYVSTAPMNKTTTNNIPPPSVSPPPPTPKSNNVISKVPINNTPINKLSVTNKPNDKPSNVLNIPTGSTTIKKQS